jgi:hypothetical protein
MLIILKAFWKEILVGVAVSFILYQAYGWAYDHGYKKAENHYISVIKEREDARDEKITQIEVSSTKLLELTLVNSDKVSKDIRGIKLPDNKPLTIITKDGKDCVPSTDYVQAYNAAINKANSK